LGKNSLKRTAILAFALMALGRFAPISAQTPELTSAEQAYRAGDYAKAADLYQTILSRGMVAGEIYYNLGNCYYKMGHYGRAILNYERARRFMGKDPDLDVNLRLANMNVPDRIEPLPRIFVMRLLDGIGNTMSAKGWATLMILSEWGLLACLAGLTYARRPGNRRLLAGAFLVTVFALAFSGGFHLLEKSHQNQPQGVVQTDKTEVRSAPEAGSTELFALHEGAKFTILRQVPGWAEIHLSDGKQGWMPKSAFEMI
jgi:tetratricopeptide (TPR) repeat protein